MGGAATGEVEYRCIRQIYSERSTLHRRGWIVYIFVHLKEGSGLKRSAQTLPGLNVTMFGKTAGTAAR